VAQTDLLLTAKLAAWAKAAQGRAVVGPLRVNVNATAYAVDCTEHGELVVRGEGPDADAAVQDACNQLWRMALEAAGAQSSSPRR
jgi:hypothetical protein